MDRNLDLIAVAGHFRLWAAAASPWPGLGVIAEFDPPLAEESSYRFMILPFQGS
jgi:hypothetical protein